MDIGYIVFFSIAYAVIGIIIGYVSFSILDEKGYTEKNGEKNYGFALGFFLLFIGLIICICKPSLIKKDDQPKIDAKSIQTISTESNENKRIEQLIKYKKLLDNGAITEEEYNDVKKRILG